MLEGSASCLQKTLDKDPPPPSCSGKCWDSSDVSGVLQTQAEQKAWQLSKELGVDVITILPSMIIGPVVSRSVCLQEAPEFCTPWRLET